VSKKNFDNITMLYGTNASKSLNIAFAKVTNY